MRSPAARVRRLPVLLVATALVAAAPGLRAEDDLPPEGGFAPRPYVALDDGVPVRAEAGFVHREIGHLRAGQEVLVDARQGRWLHVKPDGWVFADQLAPPRPPEAAPPERRVRVVQDSSRVRQGPGTSYPVVDTLSRGTELRVTGQEDGWWVLGPDRYLYGPLAEELTPATSPSSPSGAKSFAPARDDSQRRWTLMDLNGLIFEVSEFPRNDQLLAALREEMRQNGLLEQDWTFLRLAIWVPEGPYRFNYSPEQNSVVATDGSGERYGNVFMRGPVDRLPPHLRPFFTGASVAPGQTFQGVLLFRSTLRTSEIAQVEMFVGGRLQRMYPSPSGQRGS